MSSSTSPSLSTSPSSPSQLQSTTTILTPIKSTTSNNLATTTSRTNSIKRSPHLRNSSNRTSPNLNSNNSSKFNNDDHFVSNENDFIGDLVGGGSSSNSELDKCSREVLISILTKQTNDFNEIREKLNSLEESKLLESKENLILTKNIEMANSRIDQLLNDQYRM